MRIKLLSLLFVLICAPIILIGQDILFVGNSLTYSNNLPEMLKKIGDKHNVNMSTTSICYPNYALIDHINDGDVQKTMSSSKFDYLIFQQGPSSQLEGRKMLIEDGAILSSQPKIGFIPALVHSL